MLNQDFAPAVGSLNLANRLRDDLDDVRDIKATSDLDLHIVRLLALHPALDIKFRNQDLTALDDDAKQLLLADINDVLDIKPLKTPIQ